MQLTLIEFVQIVEGTIDGKFRVMCKKRGRWPQAEGKYGVDWAYCTSKPTDNICEMVPEPPPGYVDDFKRTFYMPLGAKIAFKCAQEDYLAGDQERLYYK